MDEISLASLTFTGNLPTAASASEAAKRFVKRQGKPLDPAEQRIINQSIAAASVVVKTPPLPGDESQLTAAVNINIINDYDWTYSENKKRYEDLNQEGIPRIELMEMRIKASTMLSKLRSLISSGGDITSALTGSAKDIVNAVATAIALPGAGEVINNTVGKVGDQVEKVAREIEKLVGKYGTGYIPNGNPQSKFLKPYSQLYLTEPTNIKYTLPYFDNEFLSVSNDFSDYASKTGISDNPNMIEKLIQGGTNLIDNVAGSALSLAQVAQPGVYVERPKFYNFDSLAESITIKFPLLNTLNVGAYKRNLEFINRLVLMNKPHRINKVLVDPPAIYSVNQTGVAYYPYAYISRLSVTHVGTKRIIGSDVVPDAFLITITLQPLTSNANNYMLMNDNSPIIGRHNDTFGPIKLFVKQTSGPASVEPKPVISLQKVTEQMGEVGKVNLNTPTKYTGGVTTPEQLLGLGKRKFPD